MRLLVALAGIRDYDTVVGIRSVVVDMPDDYNVSADSMDNFLKIKQAAWQIISLDSQEYGHSVGLCYRPDMDPAILGITELGTTIGVSPQNISVTKNIAPHYDGTTTSYDEDEDEDRQQEPKRTISDTLMSAHGFVPKGDPNVVGTRAWLDLHWKELPKYDKRRYNYEAGDDEMGQSQFEHMLGTQTPWDFAKALRELRDYRESRYKDDELRAMFNARAAYLKYYGKELEDCFKNGNIPGENYDWTPYLDWTCSGENYLFS